MSQNRRRRKKYYIIKRRIVRRFRWLAAWAAVLSVTMVVFCVLVQGVKRYISAQDLQPEDTVQAFLETPQTEEYREEYEEEDDEKIIVSAREYPEEIRNVAVSGMVLVNKERSLPEDYAVSLTTLKNGKQVADIMYQDLRDMILDGEKEEKGTSFLVASAYRTKEEQTRLVQEEIDKNMSFGMNYSEAYADALLTVAPSGYSEHETGLAVDIVAESNQRMDETQQYTRENIWLRENCWKYGFILRYPQGKEDVTGFSYEAWHFRYVGKEAAEEITRQGITLEEYIETYQSRMTTAGEEIGGMLSFLR